MRCVGRVGLTGCVVASGGRRFTEPRGYLEPGVLLDKRGISIAESAIVPTCTRIGGWQVDRVAKQRATHIAVCSNVIDQRRRDEGHVAA